MNLLILGINYAPEIVGIGPYTAGMAQFLAAEGHSVTVICAKPYYPHWKVDPAYEGGGKHIAIEKGVRVVRVPTYVPADPDGKRRLAHHLSFAGRAELASIQEIRRCKPDVVIGIAPSLISTIAARHAAHRSNAKLWLHIQDFEVEAAFATGLLKDNGLLGRAAWSFERWAMVADQVSTISAQMCTKLAEKGVPNERIVEFRNWANVDEVLPLHVPSPYRDEWQISRQHVAVYSGNIANKQGIEIVVEAARILSYRKDLMFVICGNGPNRVRLIEQAAGLDNIQFHDLQPRARLSELLGLASVHLLPQIAGAADLVLPSKLTNMLASGRPVLGTAYPNTGLANEIDGCGLTIPPNNPKLFSDALVTMIDDDALRYRLGQAGRRQAIQRWSRDAILKQFHEKLCRM